jgi:predicted Zn-dependent protease
MANQMLQLRYGRKDELESDDYGLKWMAQAGYDPGEMLRVMQILKEASGASGRGPSFLQTHPDPDARIETIQSYLRENYPNGVPRDLTKGRPLR